MPRFTAYVSCVVVWGWAGVFVVHSSAQVSWSQVCPGTTGIPAQLDMPNRSIKGDWSASKPVCMTEGTLPCSPDGPGVACMHPMQVIHAIHVYNPLTQKAKILCIDWLSHGRTLPPAFPSGYTADGIELTPRVALFDPETGAIKCAPISICRADRSVDLAWLTATADRL